MEISAPNTDIGILGLYLTLIVHVLRFALLLHYCCKSIIIGIRVMRPAAALHCLNYTDTLLTMCCGRL